MKVNGDQHHAFEKKAKLSQSGHMRHKSHGKKQKKMKHYLTNILTWPLVSVHDCVCDNSQQEFIQLGVQTT